MAMTRKISLEYAIVQTEPRRQNLMIVGEYGDNAAMRHSRTVAQHSAAKMEHSPQMMVQPFEAMSGNPAFHPENHMIGYNAAVLPEMFKPRGGHWAFSADRESYVNLHGMMTPYLRFLRKTAIPGDLQTLMGDAGLTVDTENYVLIGGVGEGGKATFLDDIYGSPVATWAAPYVEKNDDALARPWYWINCPLKLRYSADEDDREGLPTSSVTEPSHPEYSLHQDIGDGTWARVFISDIQVIEDADGTMWLYVEWDSLVALQAYGGKDLPLAGWCYPEAMFAGITDFFAINGNFDQNWYRTGHPSGDSEHALASISYEDE